MAKSNNSNPEWVAFEKYARKFPDNPPEKRYGIINPSAEPPLTEESMLYSDDVLKLRKLHVRNWPAVVLRRHLDNCEIMDGKKPHGFSSLIKELQ